MTQLETFARALCTAAGIEPDAQTCGGEPKMFLSGVRFIPDASGMSPAWQQFETQAQAVIDALPAESAPADASGEPAKS